MFLHHNLRVYNLIGIEMKNKQQAQEKVEINQKIVKNLRRQNPYDLKTSQSAYFALPKKNIIINGDMVIEDENVVINGDLTVIGSIYVNTTIRTHDLLVKGKLTAKNILLIGRIKAESMDVMENVWCWGLEVDKKIDVKGSINSFTEIRASSIYANSVEADFIYGKVKAKKKIERGIRMLFDFE